MKTFAKGGIHPEQNKLTAGCCIEFAGIPETVYVLVGQVLGTPAVPVVEPGMHVKTGQLIARGESFISANVHSPASGIVSKIEDITDLSGNKHQAIIIKTAGDEWADDIDRSPDVVRTIPDDPAIIVGKIKAAGIVGLGGATFPTHIKQMVPHDKKVELLIINGAECEPYLTADHRLMLEKSEGLLVGTCLLMKSLQAPRAMIGIESNKPDAINKLSSLSKNFPNIEVMTLRTKYPQGGEKQLIFSLTGKKVPSGKLPLDVNCMVQNVATVFAVYEAVLKNKPLIERIISVTGKSVTRPSNFLVRIGTPVSVLIEKAGGLPEDTGKIIAGGPMMGKELLSTDIPVVKGMAGIIILQKKEAFHKASGNCIRCGQCVCVCPMGLEPYLLSVLSEKNLTGRAEKEGVLDCIECGSCQYICPSFRLLLDNIRNGKTSVGTIVRNRKITPE